MRILYQQPHLVPPMKLTVYDELPSTPGLRLPSTMSRVVSQGKTLATRATERANFSVRRRPPRRRIGSPQLLQDGGDSFTYRPLELSIYVADNRLSDLPEFDRLSFFDDGTIRLPPQAKLRTTKSEEVLTVLPRVPSARRAASMGPDRPAGVSRHQITSSVVSTSRPPSEYDALHSHPVSTISMPGGSEQIFHHPANSVSILSPIKDEFTPPPSALLDNMVTDFPKIDNQVQTRIAHQPGPEPASVTKAQTAAAPAAPLRFSFKSRANSTATHRSRRSTASSSRNTRTAQQVNHHGHSSSVSSNSTTNTLASASTSFSEHRRKRGQFYQCKPWNPELDQPQTVDAQVKAITVPDAALLPQSHETRNTSPSRAFSPPKPIALSNCSVPKHSRRRTMSSCTVLSETETVDTDILDDGQSDTSASTAPVIQDVQINSRKSTVRSFSKPLSKATPDLGVVEMNDRLILPARTSEDSDAVTKPENDSGHSRNISTATTSVEELTRDMPPPPPYVAGLKESDRVVVIKEIGGPLRSPGVGVAF